MGHEWQCTDIDHDLIFCCCGYHWLSCHSLLTEFSRRVESKRKQYKEELGRSEIGVVQALEGQSHLGLSSSDLNSRHQCTIS